MVFWSFLAGVVTFYCSLGPESLLPNIFVSIKPKPKVGVVQLNAFATMVIYLKAQGNLFPLPCSHTSRSCFHWATAVLSVGRSSAKDTGETPAHLSRRWRKPQCCWGFWENVQFSHLFTKRKHCSVWVIHRLRKTFPSDIYFTTMKHFCVYNVNSHNLSLYLQVVV